MAIVYRYGRNLYINLTNRCPCDCTFCYRNLSDNIGDADNLWLDREPAPSEVVEAVLAYDMDEVNEIVFCGYGEPTERIDALLETARMLKERTGKRLRLDTNGLGNLINGRDIIPDLAQVLDSISISLNASSAEEYGELCKPEMGGEKAYAAILDFIRESKESIPSVAVSIVGGTISASAVRECESMAESMGVKFRIRG